MKQFQMSKQSWRKRSMSAADITGDLPIYNPATGAGRREAQANATCKLIHLVPVVVFLCFFVLWFFSYPVDLVMKDGRTIFVRRAKKSEGTSEAGDLDLTVLALDSPPDEFLSISDGPYTSLAHTNQPDASFLDSRVQNASLSVSDEPKAPSAISYELNASHSVYSDMKLSLPVSDEPRISYPGESKKAAPQVTGEGL